MNKPWEQVLVEYLLQQIVWKEAIHLSCQSSAHFSFANSAVRLRQTLAVINLYPPVGTSVRSPVANIIFGTPQPLLQSVCLLVKSDAK